jgi:hypothetical protein
MFKIRYIGVALAAPVLAVAGLLASAGGASAATHPQVMHAQILNDPDSNVTGGTWANDHISRWYRATETSRGVYDVKITDFGIWNAVPRAAAPLDYSGATHMGSEHGLFFGGADFTVTSPNGAPSQANLRKALGGQAVINDATALVGSNTQVADLFPAGATVTGSFNTWGWKYYHRGEVMVQQSATPSYTDTPVGIFTNGG